MRSKWSMNGAVAVACVLAGFLLAGCVLDGEFAPLETPPGGGACIDGAKNGNESDVDCGGVCAPCGLDRACGAHADCASGLCAQATCAPASCEDGMQDGGETDVDCGGPCPGCAEGAGCVEGGDCLGGVCVDGACAPSSCSDGAHNGDENDVDCGGSCAPCGPGQACTSHADCAGGACVGGVCAPTCTDGVVNVHETDIDCGGIDCPTCADGASCVVPGDCASDVCVSGICQAASCSDGITSGSETDVDCGGPDCAACANGEACVYLDDCVSGGCASSECGPWAKGFGPHDDDPLFTPVVVAGDAEGGIAFASSYLGSIDFGGGMVPGYLTFLAKLSRTGVHQWSRSVGYGFVNDVASDTSGNVYVGGQGYGDMGCETYAEAGGGDASLAKYEASTGTCLWEKHFFTSGTDVVARIAFAPNGDIVLLGWFGTGSIQFGSTTLTNPNPPTSAVYRHFIARLDAMGTVLWAKGFGDDWFPGYSQGLAVDQNGNIFVSADMSNYATTGTVDFGPPCAALTPSDEGDVYIAKLDAAGGCIWAEAYTGGIAFTHELAIDASGDVLYAGYSDGEIDFGGGPIFGLTIAKLDTTGAHVWSRGLVTSAYEPVRIAPDGAGNAVIAGSFAFDANLGNGTVPNKSTLSSCYACRDAFVAKYAAATGNHLFSTAYGTDAPDFAFDMALSPATGNLVVTGSYGAAIDLGAPQPLLPLGSSSAFVLSMGALP